MDKSKSSQHHHQTPPQFHNLYQNHPVGRPIQHHPLQQQPLVTIQVQVPYDLLPGRQMLVQTPAGYPISITVPESIQPGMNVPVPPNIYMQERPPMPYHYHQQSQNVPFSPNM